MTMRSNVIIILLLWGLTGCSDFLEEKSQSEIRPSTVRDMEKILEGEAYFTAEEGYVLNRGTDIFSDNIGCNVVKESSCVTLKELERYRFVWDKTMFDEITGKQDISFWQGPYTRIKGCNVVLDYIDDMEGDKAKREHLQGEAYTLRGFYYLMLVNFFGMPYNYGNPAENPGVPLRVASGVTDERASRASVAACYERIIRDLSRGAELLEANKEEQSLKLTRINYLAAYALLSRAYLYMEDWDNAFKYADLVLRDKSDLLDLRSALSGGVYNTATPAEILWVGSEKNPNSASNYKCPYTVSRDLSSLYLRDADGITDVRGDYNRVDDYMSATIAPVFLKRGRVWETSAYEYWVYDVVKGNVVNQEWYTGGVRTAEVYLNRAEVSARRYIESGNSADAELALKDLNDLRRSRFEEGYVDKQLADFANGQALLDFCLRERRRELCMEGNHRWFDLRRLGMPEITHVFVDNSNGYETSYTLHEEDSRYALPIPEEVIRRNSNLSQN